MNLLATEPRPDTPLSPHSSQLHSLLVTLGDLRDLLSTPSSESRGGLLRCPDWWAASSARSPEWETLCAKAPSVQGLVCEAPVYRALNVRPRACVNLCPPQGCPHGPGISCMLVVIRPQFLCPLTWPNPRPYVHPHRTLFTIPRGGRRLQECPGTAVEGYRKVRGSQTGLGITEVTEGLGPQED